MNTTLVFLAVCMVETGLKPNTVNRSEGAYGPAQITAACLADVNAYAGTYYNLEDFTNGVSLSLWAFTKYCEANRCTSEREMIATWRGGKQGGHRAKYRDYVRRTMNVVNQLKRERGNK